MSIASDEYQTPKKYIKAAIEVMGSINLDPACSHNNYERIKKYVQSYFSEDGLERNWYGNVWLNEPYSKPNLTLWTDKLIDEFCFNRINQIVNLVPSYTAEGWYQKLLKQCSAICLPNHRINHLINGRSQTSPRFSSTFFYLGYNYYEFTQVFDRFGKCFKN